MPLHQQAINAMRDVGDAFICQPPPLFPISSSPSGEDSVPFGYESQQEGIRLKPSYW